MKTTPLIALILVITVYGCEKFIPADPNFRPLSSSPLGPKRDSTQATDTTHPGSKGDTATIPTPPYPQQTANTNPPGNPPPACPVLPIYGDTLIFTQPSGSDYIVNPVNNPGPGKYFAWPVGLALDQNSGAIDLTQSQTGMRYVLGFVKTGSTDTCLSTLIVGGAAYYDSVYVIADGQTTSSPYFEANPYLPNPCINGGCTFDVTGSAAAKKVIVNTTTGVIDLQKTLNGSGLLGLGGAFGLLPQDGSVITVPIYYKLNDGSNEALENISVQIEYVTSKSALNSGILSGILNQVNDLLSGNIIMNSANPRPPLIIITRRD
jgi:hypothetical protein